jgi:hypothetical protein
MGEYFGPFSRLGKKHEYGATKFRPPRLINQTLLGHTPGGAIGQTDTLPFLFSETFLAADRIVPGMLVRTWIPALIF